MAAFEMPFSEGVVQPIDAFTTLFGPIGSQLGPVDIDLGQIQRPEIEQEVLSDVGTCGAPRRRSRRGKQQRSPRSRICEQVADVKTKLARPAMWRRGRSHG
jgi:hypothetical protein